MRLRRTCSWHLTSRSNQGNLKQASMGARKLPHFYSMVTAWRRLIGPRKSVYPCRRALICVANQTSLGSRRLGLASYMPDMVVVVPNSLTSSAVYFHSDHDGGHFNQPNSANSPRANLCGPWITNPFVKESLADLSLSVPASCSSEP